MPLHGALQFGNFFATKACLDNGSQIDETDNKYNNSAVHMACTLGSIELLHLFKKKQPDLFKNLVNFTLLLKICFLLRISEDTDLKPDSKPFTSFFG